MHTFLLHCIQFLLSFLISLRVSPLLLVRFWFKFLLYFFFFLPVICCLSDIYLLNFRLIVAVICPRVYFCFHQPLPWYSNNAAVITSAPIQSEDKRGLWEASDKPEIWTQVLLFTSQKSSMLPSQSLQTKCWSGNPLTLFVGMQSSAATIENSVESP